MKIKRGDIILALFPDSNSVTAKRRPALVVQGDSLATHLPQVIVAMITSNMTRAGPDFRVPMLLQTPATRGTGLKSDSVIMLDNLTTIIDRHIQRRFGQ